MNGIKTAAPKNRDVLPTGTIPKIFNPADSQIKMRHNGIL